MGRVLLAGGNASNGLNAGPFYGNWNNSAGNSNWNYAVSHSKVTSALADGVLTHGATRAKQCASLTPW